MEGMRVFQKVWMRCRIVGEMWKVVVAQMTLCGGGEYEVK